jgi:ribonuclease HI
MRLVVCLLVPACCMHDLKQSSQQSLRLPSFRIYFDGGDHGSRAYGSFDIEFKGFRVRRHRMSFLHLIGQFPLTSNTAEYLALIEALRWLGSVKDKKRYSVQVFGDSQLVVRQVGGSYRCHSPHLRTFAGICRDYLDDFGSWTTHWHSRKHNLNRFGH